MGIFKISLFLDFEPSLRLSKPCVLIIITNTFSIISQTTPINGTIEDSINSNHTHSPPPQQPLGTIPASTKSSALRPSVAVFVGLLTILVCFTFLILLYAKHCRGGIGFDSNNNTTSNLSPRIERHNSGVDRTVIESLPLFRFASLRGHKHGLECAVCLNKFEPTEVLRLLPKCKHAFHVECVDTWLDIHSTCPLCRYRVQPEDILLVNSSRKTSNSSSFSKNRIPPGSSSSSPHPVPAPPPLPPQLDGTVHKRHSSAGERGSSPLLEVIVENPGHVKRKSTNSIISSRRSFDSRMSFNKKFGGVYKTTPSRLSGTRSLDIGEVCADPKRKDGLLLDTQNSGPSSTLSNSIQENGVKPPASPRLGESSIGGGHIRHSSGGEMGSPSFLKNARRSCKISIDSWRSFNRKPNSTYPKSTPTPTHSPLSGAKSLDSINQNSDDRKRKDGLLTVDKKGQNDDITEEEHRLEHKIIIAGLETENSGEQETLKNTQPLDMLYLQTDEIILSDDTSRFTRLRGSKSTILRQDSNNDERKFNDDRSVSEITGLGRFMSNEELQRQNSVNKNQDSNIRRAVTRWQAWIAARKQQPSSPGVDASPSASTPSNAV